MVLSNWLPSLKAKVGETWSWIIKQIVNTTRHTSLSFNWYKKLKCTLVQALRLYIGRTALKGSRGIALLFLDHSTRRGVIGQHHTPAALYPWEIPGTHCTGGWAGPRAGLDRCGKSRSHRDSIPRPSNPSQSLYRLSYWAHLNDITDIHNQLCLLFMCIIVI